MNHDASDLQPVWLNSQCPRMGRYVLGPLLGRGGMGEVVESWDVVLHRTVALKLLKGMEPTAVIRSRFGAWKMLAQQALSVPNPRLPTQPRGSYW